MICSVRYLPYPGLKNTREGLDSFVGVRTMEDLRSTGGVEAL